MKGHAMLNELINGAVAVMNAIMIGFLLGGDPFANIPAFLLSASSIWALLSASGALRC